MFAGPIGGVVITKWGPRVAVILGGVFASLGYALSAISPSLDMLFITHGIINGEFSVDYLFTFSFDKSRILSTEELKPLFSFETEFDKIKIFLATFMLL